MKQFSINADSRAYLHEGGTKYYRLAKVAISHDGPPVYALLTNYGPYKTEKGDLSGHKPMHGGQSAVAYFDTEAELDRRFNAEMRKRKTRGYESDGVFDHACAFSGATEMVLQDVLRGKLGIISAHYDEIMTSLADDEAATTAKKAKMGAALADMVEKAKKDIEAKRPRGVSAIRDSLKEKAAAKTAAAAPPPVIDRGEVWGSW